MKKISFAWSQDIPIIDALIKNKEESARTRLVFDTGSGLTQIDTALMEELGYTARDGVSSYYTLDPTGEKIMAIRQS